MLKQIVREKEREKGKEGEACWQMNSPLRSKEGEGEREGESESEEEKWENECIAKKNDDDLLNSFSPSLSLYVWTMSRVATFLLSACLDSFLLKDASIMMMIIITIVVY